MVETSGLRTKKELREKAQSILDSGLGRQDLIATCYSLLLELISRLPDDPLEALLPCPFCGSSAKLRKLVTISDMYDACCENRNCGVSVMTKGGKSKEQVIEIWNTRKS
jgi:Lar family restriction alleviation protein